jgi:pyruvate dehydrogenase E2 component (dihydrolipoamide acetyltransferase)
MTEGTLSNWQAKEGDMVASGDVLAEIETDKATMEVEAVDEGRLARILVLAGTENVAVNAPIAILLEEGEDDSALDGYEPTDNSADSGPGEKPREDAPAETGPAPADRQEDAPAAAGDSGSKPAAGGRVFASPLARRIAADKGFAIADIPGTGPHGRIVRADVEAFKGGKAGKAADRKATETAKGAPQPVAATPPPAGDFEEIPLTSMRKTIAKRLVEAKQTIPHFYLTIECELDALLGMRKELNSRSDDYKISVNDFIIRAAALSLRHVPMANAIWGGDKILRSRTVDISVAVAIEGGLITPILRNSDQKGLASISNEMKELAGRAKAGKLMPEEYQGGCFAVSNLGMYGIREFSAVINPPQSAILAVGAGEVRPVVRDGGLAMATMMSVTLSCDHRVIDGALGAELLKYFKGYIQEPLTMLL